MIGIINSGIGNIASIKSALNKKSIEHKVCISKNDFDKINKIILPGVGSFKTFYENLIENSIFEILKKKNSKWNANSWNMSWLSCSF